MQVLNTVKAMQAEAERIRHDGRTIGFVPTMGYLHEGHLSLIRIAREHADVVVVSIFVNPAQFGASEDLDAYPRDFPRDERLAEEAGGDIIFYPPVEEMYPAGYLTYVHVDEITDTLCGAARPGHFQGVTTICAKFFHIVKPHVAVFGQKDAQQAVVIQRMVKDLDFGMDIIVGPIVREEDGLAMSSRNTYLSSEERQDALSLNQSLRMAESLILQKGERHSDAIIQAMQDHIEKRDSTRIDYIGIVHPETLKPLEKIEDRVLIALAVVVGNTRLIDNVIVEIA